ncbi:pyridoxamine 5'-phosphate oxidase family protein [Streptomyces sp. NBC_00996]|uniref:pyridoxamine 5'-phosphate oxidase family protein n=1 Tax=Streptomyces sp. NBC_00996 TaxID=2903710 RepID=UPI003864AB96|nr:pyridoxamine 5'-phosphate oxidase family protein [Streptomyces sp. NBC_00996]
MDGHLNLDGHLGRDRNEDPGRDPAPGHADNGAAASRAEGADLVRGDDGAPIQPQRALVPGARRVSPSRPDRPGSDGEHRLQEHMGTSDRADKFYDEQVLDRLNPRMREFAVRQEMFFLATSDRHGECDNTFRAGPPGFIQVFDDRTVAYPEYRGNGVLASLGNIQENPHVGILMIDFLQDRVGLHINGRARVVPDEEMRGERPGLPVDPVPGRRTQLWVEVTVEEAYIHCAKHIPHLQKIPARGDRAWGTDDYKRKGGDFFGSAAEAAGRAPYERPRNEAGDPPPRASTLPRAASSAGTTL